MRKILCSILILSSCSLARAFSTHELAVDVPLDGGGMLTYSRMWRLNRYFDAGFSVGGGVIKRDIDFHSATAGDFTMETESLVLPYIGPRISAHVEYIGLSLGYGAFYSQTDIEARTNGFGTLTGEKNAWGTGVYAPFLVLEFYDSKHNAVLGFGLGGFWGTSFPDLEARSDTARITTDESPITGLTITFHTKWAAGGRKSNDVLF